jgi:hypothetical protein
MVMLLREMTKLNNEKERLKSRIESELRKLLLDYEIYFVNDGSNSDVLRINGKISLNLPFDWNALRKRFPNMEEQEIVDTVESLVKDKEKELIVRSNWPDDDCGDPDCNSGLNRPLKANYMHYTAAFQDNSRPSIQYVASSEKTEFYRPPAENISAPPISEWQEYENQEPMWKRAWSNLEKCFWKFNEWLNSL